MMADSPDTELRKLFRDAYKSAERASRAAPITVDCEQLEDLLDYLAEELGKQSCDHTTRHAEQWAESHGIDWAELAGGFQELGGYCDCEIVLNVQPEEIFG
jgi:Protein of unknown function (DUF2695)